MAATRVQRFGCSLTTNLTTKQCNGSYWKGTLRRILHVQKRSGLSYVRAHTHIHTHSHSQATTQHPLKSPKKPDPSPIQTALGSPKLFSVCKWKMCLGTVRASKAEQKLASRTDIHSSPLDKSGTHTSNCGPKLMLRANSLPPPSPHAIPLCNYMLCSHPNMQE